MSHRIEFASARHTAAEWVTKGENIGEDFVTEDVALVLSADSTYVLEGSKDYMIKFIETMLEELRSL